jgi:hypothetical protein
MKNMFLKLSVAAGLLTALSFSAVADPRTAELPREGALRSRLAAVVKKETTLKGEGMCAKCELKETSSCQNAIQVNYFLEANDVSKAFHKVVCQDTKKGVSAVGTLKEEDGKKIFVARKIEVGDLKGEGSEKVLKGEAMCGKCELGETKTCQNVVRVTYYVEPNDVAKSFHKNVCSSKEKVKATGTVKDDEGGRRIFTASNIELDK